MAIDTKSLSQLIAEFRALRAKDSVTPESLGYILQRITDLLATAGTSETIAKIQTLLDGFKAAGQAITTLEQGAADRNHILVNQTTVGLADGSIGTYSNKVFIQQATTERAGAMRAQQVTDLNEARNNVRNLLKDVASLRTDLANLDDWVNQLDTNLSADIDSWGDWLYSVIDELPHLAPIHVEVRDKVLFISGHEPLVEKGYKPFLFRFCKKQNRNRQVSPQFHQKPVKGWRLMGREDVVKISSNGSISFPENPHGDWHRLSQLEIENGEPNTYSTDPANLINPHFDDNGNPVVSWGKTPVYTNDHKTRLPRMLRFRYAIVFATPGKLVDYTISPVQMKSTFAEFSVIHTPDDTWAFSR